MNKVSTNERAIFNGMCLARVKHVATVQQQRLCALMTNVSFVTGSLVD